MARKDDKEDREDKDGKRSRADAERAEARAAERVRREARRKERAGRVAKRGEKSGQKSRDEGKGKDKGGGADKGGDRPGWRERLRAMGERPAEESRGEVIQRRVSAVVILVVVAVVIMALTDAAPFFDDTSEEERVADTVERFFAAYGDGDHETMCRLFSPDVSQAIVDAGATETKGEDPESCAEILEARIGTPTEDERISVKVDTVRVSGPRAIVNVFLKTPDSSRRQTEAVELEQGPDGWLLTSPVITN